VNVVTLLIQKERCLSCFITFVNATVFFLQGPSYEQLKNIRATNILTPFAPDFKEPLLIHDGKMQWLFDHTGRRYLDMFGGILTVSVGHCHP